MKQSNRPVVVTQLPIFISQATELATYLAGLSATKIAQAMKLSKAMAVATKDNYQQWISGASPAEPAIDIFRGDLYSGLQVHTMSEEDRAYANDHLYILSGLYGILKALDVIRPYRLEMGYRLPKKSFASLYTYWGTRIADILPRQEVILNVSAAEYTKALLPHLTNRKVITPRFLTRSPKTKEPQFVVVHAKIARGAFAHWAITHRIEDESQVTSFDELGYVYDATLSTDDEPTFVCDTFGGLGLSVRLK